MEEVIEATFRNGAVARIVVVAGSHAGEENKPMVVKGAGNFWVLPCVEDFDLLGYKYKRNGRGEVGVERTFKRASKMPIIIGQRCGYQEMRETGKPRVQRGNIGKREQVMVKRSDEGCERIGEDDDEEASVSNEKRERISTSARQGRVDGQSHSRRIVWPIRCGTPQGRSYFSQHHRRWRWRRDRTHFTKWKHTWVHHNSGVVWDTAANTRAGEEDWTTKRKKVGEGRNQD